MEKDGKVLFCDVKLNERRNECDRLLSFCIVAIVNFGITKSKD